jgi:hypothetical protein
MGATLALTDTADICADEKAGRERQNATYALISVFRTTGSAGGWTFLSPDRATYTVVIDSNQAPPPNFATTLFWKNDANCNNVVADPYSWGQSGTVDVESIAFKPDGSMTGKFDITFGSQLDKVTGTFNASYCDVQNTSSHSCE